MPLKDNNKSKTEAPKSEAQSHKPTFGQSAELPETTEPMGDPTTEQQTPGDEPLNRDSNLPNPDFKSTSEHPLDNLKSAEEDALTQAKALQADQDLDGTATEEASKPETAREPEDHETDSDITQANLTRLREEQSGQFNSDDFQKDSHNPTTESYTGTPVRRPVTIDPNTGQAHYVGDDAPLNGGTVAHEADGE